MCLYTIMMMYQLISRLLEERKRYSMYSFLYSDSSTGNPCLRYVPDFKSIIKDGRDGVMGSLDAKDHDPQFVITFDINQDTDWTEYHSSNRYVNVITWGDSRVNDLPISNDCVNISEKEAVNQLLSQYDPASVATNTDYNVWSLVNFNPALKKSIKAHNLYEITYSDSGDEIRVGDVIGIAYVDLKDLSNDAEPPSVAGSGFSDLEKYADSILMNAIDDMNIFRNRLAIDVTTWTRSYSNYFGDYTITEFDSFNAVAPDEVNDLSVTVYGEYDRDVDYQEMEEVGIEDLVSYYTEDIVIDRLEFNVLTVKSV